MVDTRTAARAQVSAKEELRLVRGGRERGRGVGGEDGVLAEGGEAGDALAGGGGGVEGGDRRLGRIVVESWGWEEDGPAVDAAKEALSRVVS